MSITLAKTNKSKFSVIQPITVYKVELHTTGNYSLKREKDKNYESVYSFIYDCSCMIQAKKLSKCSPENSSPCSIYLKPVFVGT